MEVCAIVGQNIMVLPIITHYMFVDYNTFHDKTHS